jgi:hypothetical protein
VAVQYVEALGLRDGAAQVDPFADVPVIGSAIDPISSRKRGNELARRIGARGSEYGDLVSKPGELM